ncbi:GNAT family N-acetyltransferase [Proteus terrae]|uniref:GNAT family N-acetyltransferase n=1 Tax=Proteus terrae subsp. cibarius TaxID=626774 RepID=A0A6G6SAJ0_9GAMM|nr:GNAT family N-acetyltransferase [Proteus terrae]MBG2913531.1 GNAT family N-acetyltransferase [Proteus terrae subsp. cibarius]MBG3089204.1 GNAT family N-acetyltransferase [Proteus terrae subsp. cibarius]MCO4182690.1 GNAT family N-acetyltransferase [Proteus terrae]MCO4189773.1 GNAT family N-acetyltransferase [Proteus terrae]QGW02124.1 GNAT family N-acetyltransferase [Proteus terrae subsp. cibarius]
MSLKITTNPTPNEINEIYEGLLTHNLRYIQMEQYSPLAVFKEDNGKKIGGITGDILGNWLRIRYLWVDKAYRGQNIGTELLQTMELAAKEKGAKYAEVDTFSFQALPFYQKQGFVIFGTLENYPISDKKYYLRKKL